MTNPVLRYFPGNLLREGSNLWEIQGSALGSGQIASGAMPMAKLDGGGLWKCTLGGVGLWSADKRRAWRALSAISDGGSQPVIIEVRETIDAPWPIVSGAVISEFPQVPNLGVADSLGVTDALFDDDTGYENGIIEIQVVGAVALRATSMTVHVIAGDVLHGGEYFSFDHQELRKRLYRIATAVDQGSNIWAITFRPPMRAAISDAVFLDFDKPGCVMRLATPDAMDATFVPPFTSDPSVSFIEAFPPFPV